MFLLTQLQTIPGCWFSKYYGTEAPIISNQSECSWNMALWKMIIWESICCLILCQLDTLGMMTLRKLIIWGSYNRWWFFGKMIFWVWCWLLVLWHWFFGKMITWQINNLGRPLPHIWDEPLGVGVRVWTPSPAVGPSDSLIGQIQYLQL